MISNSELLRKIFEELGELAAQKIQNGAKDMTNTELVANSPLTPVFNPTNDYLHKPAGYVCHTEDNNVWRLLQPYDSSIFTDPPQNLPAQWAPVWTQDPNDARPFVAISTAPYSKGDCCLFNGEVYRSTIDNNVWSPKNYPLGWDELP